MCSGQLAEIVPGMGRGAGRWRWVLGYTVLSSLTVRVLPERGGLPYPPPTADQTLGVTPRGGSSRAVFTNFRLGLCFGAAMALLGDGQACVLCVTSLSVAVA